MLRRSGSFRLARLPGQNPHDSLRKTCPKSSFVCEWAPSGPLATAPRRPIRCESPPAWPHAPPDRRLQPSRYRPRRSKALRRFRPCTPCTRRCALGNMPLPHPDPDTRDGRERYISLWLHPLLGNPRPWHPKQHQTRSYPISIPLHMPLRYALSAS